MEVQGFGWKWKRKWKRSSTPGSESGSGSQGKKMIFFLLKLFFNETESYNEFIDKTDKHFHLKLMFYLFLMFFLLFLVYFR